MKAKSILRTRLHVCGIILYFHLIALILFFSDVFAQIPICGMQSITTNPTLVDGSELILKNTTAAKGLCIGCNSWFDDTGELRV